MENIDYEEEIWKDIEGYEGKYQVSNLGNVRSWKKTLGKYKILKPCKNGDGYLTVHLSKNGEEESPKVHRLVAEAFLENPNNYPQVNHIDEFKKTDNSVENLEWCDAKYNINYGTRTKRASEKIRGENNPMKRPEVAKKLSEITRNNPLKSKPVLQYSLDGDFIREWPSSREIERQLGFDRSHIGEACNGKIKQSRGYIWKFKD